MENLKISRLEQGGLILISIIYIFGLIFHLIPWSRERVIPSTEGILFFTNAVLLFFILRKHLNLQFILVTLALIVLNLLIEIVGVHTGQIFGSYIYGNTLSLKISGVPCVIGLNWLILIYASYDIASKLMLKGYLVPIISAILLLFLDFVMEPVAIKLDYWSWQSNEIPLKNYVCWFLICLIFTALLRRMKFKIDEYVLRIYYFICLGFFLVLRIFL